MANLPPFDANDPGVLMTYVAALGDGVAFRHVSIQILFDLLEDADEVSFDAGAALFGEGDEAEDFYLLASGEVHMFRDYGDDRIFVDMRTSGAVLGVMDFLGRRKRSVTCVASDAVRALRFSRSAFSTLFDQASALRRTINQIMPVPITGTTDATPARGATAEVVVLGGQPSALLPDGALEALTDLLAQAVAVELPGRVALLSIAPRAPASAASSGGPDDGVVRSQASAEDAAAQIARLSALYDYVFIDPFTVSPDGGAFPGEQLVHIRVLLEAPGDHFAQHVVRLFNDDETFGHRLIHTVILEEGSARAPDKVGGAVRAMLATLPFAGGGDAEVAPKHHSHRIEVDAFRLSLNLNAVVAARKRASSRLTLADLDSPAIDTSTSAPYPTEAIARWARCLMRRQLGLALGGGGSLGFAHLVLIEEMRRAGLPIDLVAGTSFGSVVGAFYCAQPRAPKDAPWEPAGFKLLLSRIDGLQLASNLGVLTSSCIAGFVDMCLGSVPLAELPIPFFPVSTNLTSGTMAVIARRSVGFGVRASGAAPGLFTPATTTLCRFVDGGVVNNVPSSVATAQKADMVVASNVLPPLWVQPAPKPCLPGEVGGLIYEFNLVRRFIDVLRAGIAAGNAASETSAASTAKVIFESRPNLFEPLLWDFGIYQQVMDRARADLAARGTIEQIKTAWHGLCDNKAHR